MTVYKRGTIYRMDFVSHGERVQKSTGMGTREEALDVERAERVRLARRRAGLEPDRPPAPKLKDFAQRFIDYIEVRCAQKPHTVDFYASKLARLLKFPPLADSALDRIDEALVESYVQFRQPHVKVATVNRELATLRRLLRMGEEWKVIDRVPRIHLLPGEREREFVLNPQQEKNYLEFAPQPLHDVAILMLDAGLRPSEVLNLDWRDVQVEAEGGYVRVRQGKSKNARRVLALTSRARTMLADRTESRKPGAGPVFTDGSGRRPLSRFTLKDQHLQARRKLKLPTEFVLYSLRHTFGTRLGASGVDPFAIMRLMGHSTVVISQRYVHPSAEMLEGAIKRLEALNDAQRGERKIPPQSLRKSLQSKSSALGSALKLLN